jgi:hypothetical protein
VTNNLISDLFISRATGCVRIAFNKNDFQAGSENPAGGEALGEGANGGVHLEPHEGLLNLSSWRITCQSRTREWPICRRTVSHGVTAIARRSVCPGRVGADTIRRGNGLRSQKGGMRKRQSASHWPTPAATESCAASELQYLKMPFGQAKKTPPGGALGDAGGGVHLEPHEGKTTFSSARITCQSRAREWLICRMRRWLRSRTASACRGAAACDPRRGREFAGKRAYSC